MSTKITPPPYVSASLLGGFESCPWRWAMSKFHGIKDSGEGARFGRLFHDVVEKIEDQGFKELRALVEEHFGDETDEVIDYINDINFTDSISGLKTVSREEKFEVLMPFGVTLVGHVDHLLESKDGKTLYIRDYKTTFKFEPSVVWSNKIQPRAYNFGVRKIKPDYENYVFQICYPRQQKVVEWDLEPENESFIAYVGKVWDEMVRLYQLGWSEGDLAKHFPQVTNESCQYCAVKDICETYKNSTKILELPVISNESDAEALVRMQRLNKALEAEISVVKKKIMRKFDVGQFNFEESGHCFSLRSSNSRNYPALDILNIIKDKNVLERIPIDFNKLFTVSTSQIDALSKAEPELSTEFNKYKIVKPGSPFIVHSGEVKSSKT